MGTGSNSTSFLKSKFVSNTSEVVKCKWYCLGVMFVQCGSNGFEESSTTLWVKLYCSQDLGSQGNPILLSIEMSDIHRWVVGLIENEVCLDFIR